MIDGVCPGPVKLVVCRRLSSDWADLADVLEIPLDHRARFPQGREPQGVWEWLEQRGRLGRSAVLAWFALQQDPAVPPPGDPLQRPLRPPGDLVRRPLGG